jgi:hypothetical protein
MFIRRRLTRRRFNTHEPIIYYARSVVEYSSDEENWRRLEYGARIDTKMKLRCVEDRGSAYVAATPAFVCDGDGPQYVKHLFINRFMPAEYYCITNSGHEYRTISEYLNNEDLGSFEELKPLFNDNEKSFGYASHYDRRRDNGGPWCPSHIYRVNCTNDLWGILSTYYTADRRYPHKVGLSPEHDQILRTLLQNIGINNNLEFYNLFVSECDGGAEFDSQAPINPGEEQWLRLTFRDPMEDYPTHSATGRIYVRKNVGGQPACFVTLNPVPVLMNA